MDRQDLFDYKNNKVWVDNRIEDVIARKETLNKLTSIYGNNTRGSSSIQDKIADNLAELIDKTNDYEKILLDLNNKVIEIEKVLEKMDNTTYRNILYAMYISENPQSLTEISNTIKKEYKHTCKLHGYALNEFDKLCIKK